MYFMYVILIEKMLFIVVHQSLVSVSLLLVVVGICNTAKAWGQSNVTKNHSGNAISDLDCLNACLCIHTIYNIQQPIHTVTHAGKRWMGEGDS